MSLSISQIKQQKSAIETLKKEVLKANDDDPRKAGAIAYCNGCIDACNIALEQQDAKNAEPKAWVAPKQEEAPKKKTRKKAVQVEEPTPEPVPEDTIDLDDLL